MKKHKVYISGQITGLPVAEYVEKFSKAEAELKAKGYEVVNPLRYELKPGSRWNADAISREAPALIWSSASVARSSANDSRSAFAKIRVTSSQSFRL